LRATCAARLKNRQVSADILDMNITIHRDDVSYGPYTMDQVKELVARGRLGRADLACVEGQSKWQPLENLIIQESFRKQRQAYIVEMNSDPKPKKKKSNGKTGKWGDRWLWKPE
jgi:hypothetical protein